MFDLKKVALIFLILALYGGGSPVWAAGATSFPVLLEPMEPRSLALGGATLTDIAWGEGIGLNPAAVVKAPRTASANFARHTLDLWSGRLSVTHPVSDYWVAGGYLTTFDYGDFERTGAGEAGQFRAAEYILGLFAGREMGEGVNAGASMKLIWGQLDEARASGAALDFGLAYDPNWERLRFGLAVNNLGVEWDGYSAEKYPLPTEVLLGGSRRLLYLPLTLSLAVRLSRSGEGDWEADFLPGKPGVSVGGGGEFAVTTSRNQTLNFRIGYRSAGQNLRVGTNSDMLAGFGFGVGLPVGRYRMDYAFAPLGALGDVHRFGVTVKF